MPDPRALKSLDRLLSMTLSPPLVPPPPHPKFGARKLSLPYSLVLDMSKSPLPINSNERLGGDGWLVQVLVACLCPNIYCARSVTFNPFSTSKISPASLFTPMISISAKTSLNPAITASENPPFLLEYTSTPASVNSVFANYVRAHCSPSPRSPFSRTSQIAGAIINGPFPLQSHAPLLPLAVPMRESDRRRCH